MTGNTPNQPFGRRRTSQQGDGFPLPEQQPLEPDFHDPDPEFLIPGKPPRRAPSKRARNSVVRLFSFLFTLALICAVGFAALIWYGNTRFNAPGPLGAATTFIVPPGATLTSVIPGLEEAGIIPRQNALHIFYRGARATGKADDLKAGEFGFKPAMSMRDVLRELTEGRPIEYGLTIPEGWTSYRVMERLADHPSLTGEMPAIPAEGSLLPNTYAFQRGATRASVLLRMQEAQAEALAKIWADRATNLPLKSPQELVILASIVEKETGIASERAHVASVFINRLRKGWRLQTDPTIIYGLWGGKGKPKDRGGLRRSEIDRKTPYNTYQIDGLPPTPIANPGLEAMKAVANPLETDDMFFVADGTGGHAFAKTRAEHNANVAKWRKIEAQRKRDAEKQQEGETDQ